MRARTREKGARLDLEALENRIVPTSASLTNGVLTVIGDMTDVSIQISQSNSQIAVSGTGQSFASSQVKMIAVEAGDGNDSVTIASSVTAESWIFAGRGNNVIQGGGGKNHIYGGSGNDTIVGGSAQDVIFAGAGHATITAPPGAQVYNGPAYQSDTISAIGQEIVDFTNQLRAQNGLPALTVSGQLTAAADIQANNEVTVGMMAHLLMGVPEPSVEARAEVVGYNYSALGENLTTGAPDVNAVMQSWINSPAHKANLLNPLYTQIGVSVAYAPNGVGYVVQDFGMPAGNEPTGPPTASPQPPSLTPTPTPTPTPPPVTTPPVSAPPVTTPPTTPPVTGSPTAPVQSPPTAQGFSGGANFNGQIYAVGSDAGSPTKVSVYNSATGVLRFVLTPYDSSFIGGARVAVGDVTGNSVPDVIVAPGPGMQPEIKVYDGVTGQQIADFLAYDWRFGGGVYVAAGDLTGSGRDEIITGAGEGGGPHVKVFDGTGTNTLMSFFAYNPLFRGGVRVAAGDVLGSGHADIITGAGPGGGPHVEVFDGQSGALLDSFFAYDPNFTGGIYVAAGDVAGTGRASIITGAGAGGGPHVKVFDGVSLATLASFMATDPSFSGGVRVGAIASTSTGPANIVTSFGNGDPQVQLLSGSGSLLGNFMANDPNGTGAFVA
ncbi:MAG TPA: CAP domain-containing protein [Gemmataceae bacterium]|jgi:uncharacterized protein YkwD|nr:CAP domain-containing protein [Gemmataceae bacterium]